jgi:hypothetical protein
MPDLIDAIGLFASTGTPDHVGSRYYVQAPGDAVGVNVVSPFVGVSQSCIFNIDDPESRDLVYVVTDTNPNSGVGDPGVVHRIVSP